MDGYVNDQSDRSFSLRILVDQNLYTIAFSYLPHVEIFISNSLKRAEFLNAYYNESFSKRKNHIFGCILTVTLIFYGVTHLWMNITTVVLRVV